MAERRHAESEYNASWEARFIKGLGTWTVNQPQNVESIPRSRLLKKYRETLVRRYYSFAPTPMDEAIRHGLLKAIDDEIRSEMVLRMPSFVSSGRA